MTWLIVVIYPNVNKLTTDKGSRSAFTGAIKQIGIDIDKLKKIGIGRIILNS